MATISIIVPLYNKGSQIRRSLNSILKQTYQNFEIIVIDDGSTDQGPEIVKTYIDPRIKMIKQKNSGPGAARNRGIEEAEGDYVAFLDADDEWFPEFLETSLEILESNNECDICVSAWYQDNSLYEIEKNISIIDLYEKMGYKIISGIIEPEKTALTKEFLLFWWTSTVFVKKSVFEHGYRFYGLTNHTYGEDYYLWLQLAFNHKFYRNCQPLAWYHNNDSNLSKGSYIANVLEAFLLWPKGVVKNIKPVNRKKVQNWLAMYAINSAHSRLGVGQLGNVLILLKKYPRMMLASPICYLTLVLKTILYVVKIYNPKLKN